MTGAGLDSDVMSRINDADGHEMVPAELWGEAFGDTAASIVPFMGIYLSEEVLGANALSRPHMTSDSTEITDETVWTVRGPEAPGAIDMTRRLQVLDQMGIERQLIFPSFGLLGMLLEGCGEDHVRRVMQIDPTGVDLKQVSRALMAGANDWAVRALSVDPDRIRAVAVLPVDTLEEMMAEARRVTDAGCKALWIPSGMPPGGRSPAHEDLDQFWAFAAQRDVAVMLHLGTEFGFVKSSAWSDIPKFSPLISPSLEIPGADIYNFATLRMAVENYLTTMVLGGVFERHPGLRFGVIECGANWLGPLMESLDMWLQIFPAAGKDLSLLPSEYIQRNVRVTAYPFEPVDTYIDRYPAVMDVLSYGSDYPHVEGGKHSHKRFFEKVSRFGEDFLEKFFVTNARWLMPPVGNASESVLERASGR